MITIMAHRVNQVRRYGGVAMLNTSLPLHTPYSLSSDDEERRKQQRNYYTSYTTSHPLVEPTSSLSSSRLSADVRYSYRSYHATTKKEILPLVAMGALVMGVYSFKALRRMDEEWGEYEEALREYRLEHGDDSAASDDDNDVHQQQQTASSKMSRDYSNYSFHGGVLAMDMGNSSLRIAHLPNNSNNNNTKPSIIVNREGLRMTPSAIILESDGTSITGHMALGKLYERAASNNPVLLPHSLLMGNNDNEASLRTIATQQIISSSARDALEQILGSNASNNADKILFSIDSSLAGGFNVKPIFTYPPIPTTISTGNANSENVFLQRLKEAIETRINPPTIASFIPEPVSAIQGARRYNILPNNDQGTIMVIDVGGTSTSISMVNEANSQILYHLQAQHLGGDLLVNALMDHLSKSFFQQPSSNVSDGMAVQRLYDASSAAILEISSNAASSKKKHGRVQINIPYLSVDEKMQPKHLNMGVGTQVLHAEFTTLIQSLIPQLNEDGVLATSMKDPTDLSSLLTSMVLNVFESSGINPFTLNSVLLVGGGARQQLFQKSVKDAFSNLAGSQYVADKVVIPKDELIEELVVLGAAVSTE